MDFDLFRLLFQFKFHKMETSNRGVNKMKQIRILLCESNSEIREQMEQELRKKFTQLQRWSGVSGTDKDEPS